MPENLTAANLMNPPSLAGPAGQEQPLVEPQPAHT